MRGELPWTRGTSSSVNSTEAVHGVTQPSSYSASWSVPDEGQGRLGFCLALILTQPMIPGAAVTDVWAKPLQDQRSVIRTSLPSSKASQIWMHLKWTLCVWVEEKDKSSSAHCCLWEETKLFLQICLHSWNVLQRTNMGNKRGTSPGNQLRWGIRMMLCSHRIFAACGTTLPPLARAGEAPYNPAVGAVWWDTSGPALCHPALEAKLKKACAVQL